MRNALIACTVAVLTTGSFALPAMADEVFVTGQPSYNQDYDNGYRHHRSGVIISDRGITVGSVHQRNHYQDRDRCYSKTITRENSDGDQVTKTIRHCD